MIVLRVARSARTNTARARTRWKTTRFLNLPGMKLRPRMTSLSPTATLMGETPVMTGYAGRVAAWEVAGRAKPQASTGRIRARSSRFIEPLEGPSGGTRETLSAGRGRWPRSAQGSVDRDALVAAAVAGRPREQADLTGEALGGGQVDGLAERDPQGGGHARRGRGAAGAAAAVVRRGGGGGQDLDVLQGQRGAAS